jgi:hypothetical protein
MITSPMNSPYGEGGRGTACAIFKWLGRIVAARVMMVNVVLYHSSPHHRCRREEEAQSDLEISLVVALANNLKERTFFIGVKLIPALRSPG